VAQVVRHATATLLRVAADGTHPHLAAALSGPMPGEDETAEQRFGRILGLVLDGLLPEP
jgi:hypothetical protein